MKTINNFFKNIVKAGVVLTAACFTACQDYSIDSQPAAGAKLECDALEQYNIVCTSPDQVIFNVSANTPWKIEITTESEDKSWCTANPSMSSASGLISEVTVSFSDNEVDQAREATLSITAEGVETPITVKMIQEAYGNLAIVDATELASDFSKAGSSKKFTIRSNKAWEIVNENAWLTFEPISGEGSEEDIEITVTSALNDGDVRSGSFSVKTSKQETTPITVRQEKAVLRIDNASELSSRFDRTGGSKKFTLLSDTAWEIVCEDTWLTFEPKAGEGSAEAIEVTVTGAANEGGAREGSFYVKTSKLQTNPVSVNQDGLILTFEITDEEKAKATNLAGAGATDVAVAVTISGVTYTASSEDEWIKNIEVDDVTGIFTFDVDANVYFYSRSGQIVLHASDPSLDDITIDVTQQMSTNYKLWGISDQTEITAPEGMFTEKGLKLTAANAMRIALPGAYTNGTLVIEFDEVTTVAQDKELVICGATNYNPSNKPNTHLLFGDKNNNLNGPNDWRVNGVYGWSTHQGDNLLKEGYTAIKKVELTFTATSASMKAENAAGEVLTSKTFTVNANWSEGTFSYFIYYNTGGTGSADSYCVIKSFYFIPAE